MLNVKNTPRFIITLITVVCLIGCFLRLYFYIVNRSLWLDESLLALNIINRSFAGLFSPLDLDQGAPIGFLLTQKTLISLLGIRDYILRIVPLCGGVFSIGLMYQVSKKYSGWVVSFISLLLFALSPVLIYYSSEAKQYSTDVFVALLLLLIAHVCLEEKDSSRAFVALGLAGFFSVWFSHPSVFIFASILLTLGLTFVIQKDKRRSFWLIGAGILWGVSFGIEGLVSLRHLVSNDTLLNFWRDSFAPLPPWSNFGWYGKALTDLLNDPSTLPDTFITVGVLVIGIFSFAFRRWQFALILFAPFLFTLSASALGKYPFGGRLLLFLVPLLFLLLANGVRQLGAWLMRLNKLLAWSVSGLLVIYFIFGALTTTLGNLASPPHAEDIKPVMSYLNENYRDTDSIYLYYGAKAAFEFYAPQYDRLAGKDFITGIGAREEPTKYLADVDQLKGQQRVWIVFSHVCGSCQNEKKLILQHLDQIGFSESKYESTGASVYLYDLQ